MAELPPEEQRPADDADDAEGGAAEAAAGADAASPEVPAGDGELAPTQVGQTAPSAGTLLREAREGRGLSVEELARMLNLQPRIVTALERDDHEALPAAAFVRGYLRSYARLLGIDARPLLEDHDRRAGGVVVDVKPSPLIEESRESVGLVHRRPGTVMAVAIVGVLALVIGGLLLLRPEAFGPGETTATIAASAPPPAAARVRELRPAPRTEPLTLRSPPGIDPTVDGVTVVDAEPDAAPAAAAVMAPTADPPEDEPDEAGGGTSVADADAAVAATAADATAADAAAVTEAAAPEEAGDDGILRTRSADGLGIRVYAGGEDHLRFTFGEDCWVEIRDADDVDVYQDLNRDGQVLDLWGRAPFRILLGNAPAVELTYNGSRVALRPFTRNDVASLTLGR